MFGFEPQSNMAYNLAVHFFFLLSLQRPVKAVKVLIINCWINGVYDCYVQYKMYNSISSNVFNIILPPNPNVIQYHLDS